MANFSVWEQWTIDVKESLKDAPAVLEKEVIYAVPSCLKNEQTRLFYHPKQISFGPRHFELSSRTENFTVSENFKSEVARSFNPRLKALGITSLVENFKSEHMERLQISYGKEVIDRFPENNRPDGLSWMLARDGCFLLDVLHSFEDGRNQGEEGTGMSRGQKTVLQHILDRENHHPLLNEIVKDMFKLENQLPLWVLEEIRLALERPSEAICFDSALKNLCPVEITGEAGSRTYKNRIHILQLLGEYMIDNNADPSPTAQQREEADDRAFLPRFTRQHGERNNKKQLTHMITVLSSVVFFILFLLLSPVLILRSDPEIPVTHRTATPSFPFML
ncbi:hypothetical protein SUGI_0363940 [Cryptomeria japonica]|nr:hypothetical protein SUGI_0363940 [Cryptomeria japonica]